MFVILPQQVLSKTIYGYMFHIIVAFLVGDLCSYTSHRLLHFSYFYQYHKIHHQYMVPHTFVGVYNHPFEAALNYIAILIPLTITSSYNDTTLMLETIIIAMGILLSHRADVDLLFDFGAKMHNIHHKEINYNYGFSMVWDWLFGTLKV
jgi:sterol desaturase/sphingolipid hydroxylase (fatty acid hydroxylase superfamily)